MYFVLIGKYSRMHIMALLNQPVLLKFFTLTRDSSAISESQSLEKLRLIHKMYLDRHQLKKKVNLCFHVKFVLLLN